MWLWWRRPRAGRVDLKTLERSVTVIRHAKAVADLPSGGPDFDRPLSPRGTKDVYQAGLRLSSANVSFDCFLASSAIRARQTAEALADAVGFAREKIEWDEGLYLASLGFLMQHIASLADEIHHVALVGHNPGLSELWAELTHDPDPFLPTCGIVRLDFALENWGELFSSLALRATFDDPRGR